MTLHFNIIFTVQNDARAVRVYTRGLSSHSMTKKFTKSEARAWEHEEAGRHQMQYESTYDSQATLHFLSLHKPELFFLPGKETVLYFNNQHSETINYDGNSGHGK